MRTAITIAALLLAGCSSQQPANLDLAAKLLNEGLHEQALPYLANPQDSRGYRLRAAAYIGLGQFEQAKADVDEALRLNPKDDRALEVWGGHLLREANHEQRAAQRVELAREAEVYLKKAVDIAPDEMLLRKQLQAARMIVTRGR